MKFLANLCISPRTVKYLRKFGYEVYRVNEIIFSCFNNFRKKTINIPNTWIPKPK